MPLPTRSFYIFSTLPLFHPSAMFGKLTSTARPATPSPRLSSHVRVSSTTTLTSQKLASESRAAAAAAEARASVAEARAHSLQLKEAAADEKSFKGVVIRCVRNVSAGRGKGDTPRNVLREMDRISWLTNVERKVSLCRAHLAVHPLATDLELEGLISMYAKDGPTPQYSGTLGAKVAVTLHKKDMEGDTAQIVGDERASKICQPGYVAKATKSSLQFIVEQARIGELIERYGSKSEIPRKMLRTPSTQLFNLFLKNNTHHIEEQGIDWSNAARRKARINPSNSLGMAAMLYALQDPQPASCFSLDHSTAYINEEGKLEHRGATARGSAAILKAHSRSVNGLSRVGKRRVVGYDILTSGDGVRLAAIFSVKDHNFVGIKWYLLCPQHKSKYSCKLAENLPQPADRPHFLPPHNPHSLHHVH